MSYTCFKKHNLALKEQNQTKVRRDLFMWVFFNNLANSLACWASNSDICFWRGNILSPESPYQNERNDFVSPFFLPQKICECQYLLDTFLFCLSQQNWLLQLAIENSDTQHVILERPLESGRAGMKCKSFNLYKPHFLASPTHRDCVD